MRAYVRFAAISLSLVSLSAGAAELRDQRDPAKIFELFPRSAKLWVVNVWATWCAPCVAEMPDLKAIDDAFGAEVGFAGVSMDNMIPGEGTMMRRKVTKFLDKHHIRFPNVYYIGTADALADSLRFDGELPFTVIFDRNGKEVWRHAGRLEREKTIADVRKLLKGMK